MTDFHNYNTPAAGAGDWHEPLNENFERLDADIEIRDTEANRSSYSAKSGAKFLATDTGQVYIGDGSEWQPIASTGPDPEFDTVNGVRWASSPDDINTQLRNLPDHGGTVRLRPGEYFDEDWTEPIEIPENDGNIDTLTIDMRGSYIVLDDFKPDQPYISRPISQSNSLCLYLYGPDLWNVNRISDPPTAVQLFDISMSYVWLPKILGPVKYAVEKRSKFTSGHFNRIYAKGWNVRSGFKIGDSGDDQTSDRSFYYGQFGQVTNYGANVEKGKWNTIYAQVENTDGTGPGYGCYIPANSDLSTADNQLKIQERGADTPFYIVEPRTQIDLVGGIAGDAWSKARHVVPPERVTDAGLHSETYEWSTDMRSQFDIGGSHGSTELMPYRALRLDAGASDGGDSYIQTVANATGTGDHYARVWGVVNPISQSNAIHRFGMWENEDNLVMARADMSGDGNWHLVVRSDGTVVADEDTGMGATKGGTIISVGASGSEQYVALHPHDRQTAGIASSNTDISGFNRTNMRADTTVVGAPSSSRQFDVRTFAYERT